MGFSISYHSTRPVNPEEAAAVKEAASRENAGRTWLSCEPIFFHHEDDGRLFGASKPNFQPDPGDAASAAREGLPDGDVRDLIEALCRLSRDHRIDWEIGHDASPGPIGLIRDGVCDPDVMSQVEALAEAIQMIAEEMDLDELGEGFA